MKRASKCGGEKIHSHNPKRRSEEIVNINRYPEPISQLISRAVKKCHPCDLPRLTTIFSHLRRSLLTPRELKGSMQRSCILDPCRACKTSRWIELLQGLWTVTYLRKKMTCLRTHTKMVKEEKRCFKNCIEIVQEAIRKHLQERKKQGKLLIRGS